MFASEVFRQVRIADVLDIAIVSVALYLLLTWLRSRASRSLGMVLLLLTATFLLARWLDLYMTTAAFQYGLTGLVLAFVLVFQQDIRHGVDRLAAYRWFTGSAGNAPTDAVSDAIVEAVVAMAKQRTGALVVFPGREPLDRHVRGGIDVDAEISFPLILSIFHSDSPGHDGAIVIENSRIERLGVHLPLTSELQKLGSGGTRHAAALGLAERCDAMIVVVSEERGTITIAREGDISVVDSAALSDLLRGYFTDQAKPKDASSIPLLGNLGIKCLAVVLGMIMWYSFAYRTDTIQRTFGVPVEYRNLPEDWEIDEPKTTYVDVTLSGSEPAFAMLDPAAMTVSVQLDQVGDRRVIRVPSASSLKNIPTDLTVERAIPEEVVVRIHPKSGE